MILRDTIAKYSWYVLRWAIGWEKKRDPYVFAYMAHPDGYVVHERATKEHELGLKAELVVFRRADVPDPRLTPRPTMAEGGYL